MARDRKHWLIAVATPGALAICTMAAPTPGGFRERLSLAARMTTLFVTAALLRAHAIQRAPGRKPAR